MTQDGVRDQVILRDLGDGLILRRATPEGTKALVAFNTELHRDWDTQEPDQGVVELTDLAIFCRGLHPTAIADATLVGINLPIRIGQATVLPGDVVLGTPTGVIFIPPHLVREVVGTAEDIRLRDQFGKQRLHEGCYTPAEIDRAWSPEIEADFQDWLKRLMEDEHEP